MACFMRKAVGSDDLKHNDLKHNGAEQPQPEDATITPAGANDLLTTNTILVRVHNQGISVMGQPT